MMNDGIDLYLAGEVQPILRWLLELLRVDRAMHRKVITIDCGERLLTPLQMLHISVYLSTQRGVPRDWDHRVTTYFGGIDIQGALTREWRHRAGAMLVTGEWLVSLQGRVQLTDSAQCRPPRQPETSSDKL